jgi:hypothetical protein
VGKGTAVSISDLPTPTKPGGISVQGWWYGPVLLQNLNSGKCLGNGWQTNNGQFIFQWDCIAGDPTQQWWVWFDQGDGSVAYQYYYNVYSRKCMEVDGWSTLNYAQVQQWDCHWGANQYWLRYGGVENGGYWVEENWNSHKCLDMKWWSTANMGRAIQYDCHGMANQRWRQV